MVFKIKSTLDMMHGYMAASGLFVESRIGEYVNPPRTDGISGSVMMQGVEIRALNLQGTMEIHSVLMRFYHHNLHQPVGEIDLALQLAMSFVQEDLLGDMDLGASIRAIDAVFMDTDFKTLDIGGQPYRVADMIVPLIVDDAAILAA